MINIQEWQATGPHATRATALVVSLVILVGANASATFDDASEQALVSLADAAESIHWVGVEGKCFTMGDDRIYREETPPRETCVDDFQVSRHEITNAQFAAFVLETDYVTRAERGWHIADDDWPGPETPAGSFVFFPSENPRSLNDWWRFVAGANWLHPKGDAPLDARFAAFPVVQIVYEDALAFAEWADARLPSEAEWEYAARGGLDGEIYSWSAAEDAAIEDKANTWQGVFPIADTGDDGFDGIAPVGSFPANGFGLFDMIGNVWEWTDSAYYPSHDDDRWRSQREEGFGFDPSQGDRPVRVLKGGSFLCSDSYCFRFRPAARQAQDLALGTSHIGFRVVRSPQ